ncbi:MAG: S-methyl-5-thioribose-1-phosphate isomerase [Spirochaetaceae bacterium]
MRDIRTIEWVDGILHLIDQRKLPQEYTIYRCSNYRDVEFAIRDMVVRGAPAIGATAAYGVYLASLEFLPQPKDTFLSKVEEAALFIEKARPTAVNLSWAVRRMQKIIGENRELSPEEISAYLKEEADRILAEDVEINKTMAKNGNSIVPAKAVILTHCNTGALATAGWGTALGVVREAHASNKSIFVYADETRPRLQGARLTAWELVQEGIPSKLIVDSTAAFLMQQKKVDLVLTGADRIASNGDTSNKIGTYMLAVSAHYHSIPFYIVAPTSTIDFDIASGEKIPIEEREPSEITRIGEAPITPQEMDAYNPAFDVTPADLITGIITEKGILYPPYSDSIASLREE